MLKHMHLLFVAVLVISFIGRVLLAEFKPELLAQKWQKFVPHVIAALVLLTGFALVFQGNWLAVDYGWIVAKLLLVFVYIALGVLTMRQSGNARWLVFAAALLCLFIISKIALTKQIFFFL